MKTLSAVLIAIVFALPSWAQTVEKPSRSVTDPGVVTTRQNITPAGVPTVFDGRLYGVSFGEKPNEIYALTARGRASGTQVYKLDWQGNRILNRQTLKESPGLQGLLFDPVSKQALITGSLGERETADPKGLRRSPNVNPDGKESYLELSGGARLLTMSDGNVRSVLEGIGNFITGAPAVAAKNNARGQRLAIVPLIYNNQLAVIDLNGPGLIGRPAVGIAPFGAAISADGSVAYVTNWGGRLPKPGDLTAPTGLDPKADQVVVDERGIASTGTVTRIDLATMKATHTIAVELHPTGIVWDEERQRLYVANGNKDSVSVIDTAKQTVLRTISLRPAGLKLTGVAPTALAVSADGSTLYAACGGLNAVAVVSVNDGTIAGWIPTGWYPSSLSLSPDGRHLAVGALLGAGSSWREEPRKRFVHAYRGSVSVVALPDRAQLNSYTTAVLENNHLTQLAAASSRTAANTTPAAVPARAGDASLIEYVVYIIKENRTYDQVFGDMEKGNGDPSLVMFGNDVTPNHHRLADQFVLLDNFYATGGNSGDGHQWATQANETAYCMWPGYVGRSYPFDGTDPIAYSDGGFIWDAALRMKKTARVFGEYAGRLPESDKEQRNRLFERWKNGEDFTKDWDITAPIKPLNRILAKNYPAYTQAIPDVVRAKIFGAELKEWEKAGQMPNLVVLQLPSDHTRGTTPGAHTPRAMVADNDLALGQIVEALSNTPFWKKMAIFVVEDDAQNGVDHVDGHRTVALAISPYIRRGHVDSTFYSNQSMVKTIELMLGLPTLSLFDLIANDMRASFTNTPDFTPYHAVEPRQSIFELNPSLKALRGAARRDAMASMRMRFDVPDAVPTETLNRILWRQVKGANIPYPRVRQSAFAPLALELEDDERSPY